jgi:hypothetical protein
VEHGCVEGESKRAKEGKRNAEEINNQQKGGESRTSITFQIYKPE